jgi:hypothetical protein
MLALRGEEFADIRTVLTALDTTLRAQAETLTEVGEEVAQLPVYDERLSHLQTGVGALQARVGDVHSAVSAAPSQATIEAAVAAAVGPLAQRLTEISAASAAQSATLVALQRGLDPLAGQLAALSAEIAGLAEGTDDGGDSLAASMYETERRLTAHIDEAVLALAEALLRRRISTPRPAGTQSAVVAADDAAPTEPAAVDDADAADTDIEFAAATEPELEPELPPEPEAVASAAESEPEMAADETATEAAATDDPATRDSATGDSATDVDDPDADLRPAPDPAEAADAAADEPFVAASESPATDSSDADTADEGVEDSADSPAVITSTPEVPPYFATPEAVEADLDEPDPPAVWWEQEIGTISPPADESDDDADIGWVAVPADDDSAGADPASEDSDESSRDSAHDPDRTQAWSDDPFTTTELPRVEHHDDDAADSGEPIAPSSRWSPEAPPTYDAPEQPPGPEDHDAPKRRRRWF